MVRHMSILTNMVTSTQWQKQNSKYEKITTGIENIDITSQNNQCFRFDCSIFNYFCCVDIKMYTETRYMCCGFATQFSSVQFIYFNIKLFNFN